MAVQHLYQPDFCHNSRNLGIVPTMPFFTLKAPSYTQGNLSTDLYKGFFPSVGPPASPKHVVFIMLLVHICRKEVGSSTPPPQSSPFLLLPKNWKLCCLTFPSAQCLGWRHPYTPLGSMELYVLADIMAFTVCCCWESVVSEVAITEIPAILDRIFNKSK